MTYQKPYLPVSDQLSLIKNRGMAVSDDALAQSFLNKIGYYRLSGYWYPYRNSEAGSGGETIIGDTFRQGAKFVEVVDLYVFDKKLRMILMDAIERIEIALRVQITLELGKLGPNAHRDTGALHPKFSQFPASGGESSHQKWLRLHDDAFGRSKEEFAKHFKAKYAGENPPIWIAAELWDFGAMSFLYSGMRKADQTAVASFFNVPNFAIMETWLRALNVTRNICAHHSRLWNKPNGVQPKWPTPSECPDLGHIHGNTLSLTRVYAIACMCAYLLKTINPNSSWVRRFKATAETFPNSNIINISSAGFPTDWKNAHLWA